MGPGSKSGVTVAGAIVNKVDYFPDHDDDDATIACAVRCGVLAVQYSANDKIDPAIFAKAWEETQKWMFALIKDNPEIKALAC